MSLYFSSFFSCLLLVSLCLTPSARSAEARGAETQGAKARGAETRGVKAISKEELHKQLAKKGKLIQSIEYEIVSRRHRLNELRSKLVILEQNRIQWTKAQKASNIALIRLIRRPENIPLISGVDLARGERLVSNMRDKISDWLLDLSMRNQAIARLALDAQRSEQILKTELIKRRDAHRQLEYLIAQKKPYLENYKIWKKLNHKIAQQTKNTSTLISEIIDLAQKPFSNPSPQDPHYLLPGVGKITTRFGEKNKDGRYSLGILFEMRPKSHIIAPASGQVIFAGPFRNYNQIAIIASAGHHHILLGGMKRLDVKVGDVLLAGEPIGLMSDQKNPKPILYLEIRHHGRPINPQNLLVQDKKPYKE